MVAALSDWNIIDVSDCDDNLKKPMEHLSNFTLTSSA